MQDHRRERVTLVQQAKLALSKEHVQKEPKAAVLRPEALIEQSQQCWVAQYTLSRLTLCHLRHRQPAARRIRSVPAITRLV